MTVNLPSLLTRLLSLIVEQRVGTLGEIVLVEPGNDTVGPRTVVVQLALLGVGNQISVVPGAVRVDGERQGRDGVGWCCR